MILDSQILQHIETRLRTIPWVSHVEWKRLRLTTTDFREHEVPLIQFYDNGQVITHEQGRLRVEWNISVEVVLRTTAENEVDVVELLDKRQDVEQCLGAQETSALPGLLHLRYTGNEPDYLSILPFFVTRLDFQALYYKAYSRPC